MGSILFYNNKLVGKGDFKQNLENLKFELINVDDN